ncbi:DUF4403 family protein [Sandarakinorhabdus sp. DWP1-3-1]|uniref:DUF4403 family protein n=1 Tax=Sandarakinorhabdus sp. DWP1-3-1 TaxID=2804627 RepID=UPI003CF1BDEA
MARGFSWACLLLMAASLAACSERTSNPAPPRLTSVSPIQPQSSTIVVPISARVADLEARLNAEVPQTLVEIDKQTECVKAARVTACVVPKLKCKGLKCEKTGCEVGLDKARITPDISCRIVGRVTRGPIRLSGSGDVIRLVMPVSATVAARDVGHVIKSETATAAAEVRASIRLGMTGNWQPTAKVDIDYDWTEKPGISLLGARITFAGRADPEVARIIARLQARIPTELERLHPRDRIETAWKKGFTAVMLNRTNPPVWLRIAPQQLRYDGYHLADGELMLKLAVLANTETFIGKRPPDPPATPLPPPSRIAVDNGFRVHIPVVAEYDQLEPVLARALKKLARQPIELPGIGAVTVEFGRVRIYATTVGRLAIGVDMKVTGPGGLVQARGTVWATGIPYNEPGSQRVLVRDLRIDGRGDDAAFDVLLAVMQAPPVQAELRGGLSQNFARDYAKLLVKIDRALTEKRLGDFVLSADITGVRNGVVTPFGQGLFMPVDAEGAGSLRYAPTQAPK